MASAKQLCEREKLCRERAKTARNPTSRANFLAFADEYRRQAGRSGVLAPNGVRGPTVSLDLAGPADLRRVASELMRLMGLTRDPLVLHEFAAWADRCLERANDLEISPDYSLRSATG
jgi:hypothetical protein